MSYHENEMKLSLLKRKARLTESLANAENSLKRHQGIKGYGNEVWENHFEERVIALKQRIYEINLELDRFAA